MDLPANARRKGVLMMIGAGLCWSAGGIFVRSAPAANEWLGLRQAPSDRPG